MKNRTAALNRFLRRFGFGIHHVGPGRGAGEWHEELDQIRLFDPSDKRIEEFFVRESNIAHLSRLVDRFEPGLVIDIGANEGQFATLIREAGFRNLLFSVEPNPVVFAELTERHPEGEFQVNQSGLVGAETREVEFPVSKSSEFSSLHPPSDLGEESFGEFMESSETVICEMKPLLAWLESADVKWDAPVFLKTDTQGHDLEVLRGAEPLFSNTAVILTEIAIEPLYEGAPDREEMES
ncbi:MAG: FkbM family methyltransferase, partial [Verrucomicrobiota bacterium]